MIPKFRAWFPAPREVDRYLYQSFMMKGATHCFRPLPRLIGTYTRKELEQAGFGWVFPAPLEVNRLFYRNGDPYIFHPLFPAPREVDRCLYFSEFYSIHYLNGSFRPLAR